MQLKAVPPTHAGLGVARPVPQRAVLARPRHVTDGHRGGVLQDNGIGALGVAVTV